MKISTTILSATLLAGALALAGCGGSSSGDGNMDDMPSAEDQCKAIYIDGECKTPEDLKAEGAEEEGQRRDEEAAAAKRQADAKKFHGLLSAPGAAVDVAQPENLAIAGSTYETQIGAAENGAYDKAMIRIMIGNTMGSSTQAAEVGGQRDMANSVLIMPGNAKHVMGSGFATGQNERKTHDEDDEVGGSYMGAQGKYTCTGGECTSQRTANGIQLGAVSGGSGAWTFVPGPNSKYSIPDANYAQYGWWIDETAATTTARVGAWYTNNAGAEIANLDVSGSSGTASYTGQAIGVAAYYHSLGGDTNAGGAFTADAMLSANFDTNKLSGSITNFDVGGHNPDWSVALGSAGITPGSSAVSGGTTTWTVGGTAGTARLDAANGGGWTAKFYDIPGDDAHQPTGVAGGFKAQYDSDGYMVGAFGAEQ